MKKKILLAIRILVFLLLVGIVLSHVYSVLKWKDTNGGYLSSIEQLYNSERDTMDVVFMGSSHCYCGIVPTYFWENYGIASFDMSTSGQHKEATTHMLKELLKYQQPKLVVIDLYAANYEKHTVLGNIYRNLLSMKLSRNSVELIEDYMNRDSDTVSIVPVNKLEMIAKWPVIHSRYKELTSNDFGEYTPNTYMRGDVFHGNTVYQFNWSNEPSIVLDSTPISDSNRKWIDELEALSAENGFELVFIVIPYDLSDDIQRVNNGVTDYIREKGIRCVDYNLYRDDIGLNSLTDFEDPTHLNAEGAIKFSQYLADDILLDCNFADHRGQTGYEAWDEACLLSTHVEINNYISDIADNASSLGGIAGIDIAEMLGKTEGYTCVLSFDGPINEDVCNEYAELFGKYGISKEQLSSGGKWLIKDDVATLINANDLFTPAFYLDLSKSDTLKICYGASLSPANIMIGSNPVESPHHFVTFVVYDELLGKMVIAKGL